MEYNVQTINEIVIKYSQLKSYLQQLKDVKEDQDGAILGYIASIYASANDCMEYLRDAPKEMRKELRFNELEKELLEFANTHINL